MSLKALGFDSYAAYLKGEHWLTTRAERLKVEPTCKACGSDSRLRLHHVCYSRLGYEKHDDLIVMCDGCHQTLHEYLDATYPGKDLPYKVKRTYRVWLGLFGKHLDHRRPGQKPKGVKPSKAELRAKRNKRKANGYAKTLEVHARKHRTDPTVNYDECSRRQEKKLNQPKKPFVDPEVNRSAWKLSQRIKEESEDRRLRERVAAEANAKYFQRSDGLKKIVRKHLAAKG